MKNKTIMWLDIEAGDYKTDRDGAVHEISYILDIDGETIKKKAFKCAPFQNDLINAPSLDVCGVDYNTIKGYPPPEEAFKEMVNDIHPYKKVVIGGFNCQAYDFPVFINWWYKCARHLKSWDIKWVDYIYPDTLDVRIIALEHLMDVRGGMENFKLMTVAKELGVDTDGKAHTADFDIEVTRNIYYKIKSSKL